MNCRMTLLEYVFYLIICAMIIGLAFVLAPNVYAQSESKAQLERYIIQSSHRHGLDPKLALAIAEVESGFNPDMIGSLGEVGIYQLRPEYHHVVKGNTKQNIDIAIQYLVKLKSTCNRYGDAFFVCYNYGPTRALKYPHLFPYYKRVKTALAHQSRSLQVADLSH